MALYERVGNLHIHTTHSDGSGSHAEVAQAAASVGLDFVIVTDHNSYLPSHEGWHGEVLLLVGEEVHAVDNSLANHLLVFDAREAMAPYGDAPQPLLDAINARGGLSFIAHPVEKSGAAANEPEIDWTDWEVSGFTGLELWNYMSEFKAHVTSRARALLYAFAPKLGMMGPFPETLRRWDALLADRPAYVVGGSDAHALTYRMGPVQRCLYPYAHLFRQVNTHVLVSAPWSGDAAGDGALIYEALRHGRAFVGYDGLAPTRGFRFEAHDGYETHAMGARVTPRGSLHWHVEAPARAHLRLLHDGHPIAENVGAALDHTSQTPGVYRVEAYRRYAGRWRGWVFTNPIWVRESASAGSAEPGRTGGEAS
jgi:hypothetical protein